MSKTWCTCGQEHKVVKFDLVWKCKPQGNMHLYINSVSCIDVSYKQGYRLQICADANKQKKNDRPTTICSNHSNQGMKTDSCAKSKFSPLIYTLTNPSFKLNAFYIHNNWSKLHLMSWYSVVSWPVWQHIRPNIVSLKFKSLKVEPL